MVLYYSQTGVTKSVAEELASRLNADIEAIEAEAPYSGDFGQTVERVRTELQMNTLVPIQPVKSDLAQYDVIFLGSPIWCGEMAPPVSTFLQQNYLQHKFDGKRVVPFCTFGSGGLEQMTNQLKNMMPLVDIAQGYGVRTARISAMSGELDRFLKQYGYVKGEVAALPDFSEQQAVTETEIALFNKACGNYQFPLGTPVSYGKRKIESGTEYEFTVEAKTSEEEPCQNIIYVTASVDGAAEFTRVVR